MRDFYCNIVDFDVFFFKHYAAESSSDLQGMYYVFNVQGRIYTNCS